MENEEKLGKMRYWLTGLFLIISGAVTAILSLIPESSIGMIMSDMNYWKIIGVIAVATAAAYFLYSFVLNKN